MSSINCAIQGMCGFVLLIFIAFVFSENKKEISWKLVLSAFLMQNILFLLISYVPIIHDALSVLASAIVSLLGYANDGASFVFGSIADRQKNGFIFGLVVLPTMVFFGGLVGVLYFLGIIQKIIHFLAYWLRKTIKLSGAESLVVIADIFLGQAEGPLVIGPYIAGMTRSELACAFIAGLANISGSTLGMYLVFLGGNDPVQIHTFANYLVTASFMNAASAIVFAKLLFPETCTSDRLLHNDEEVYIDMPSNFVDSLFAGAIKGLRIGATIIAALIVAIALTHMVDGILNWFGSVIHVNQIIASSTGNVFSGLSVEYLLGQIFRIFAFFMGISWSETLKVGSLLGQKVVVNEFVAYMSLGHFKVLHALSDNAIFISTFALASFSNLSSIGISLGSYSVLAPNRTQELTGMALKCLFGAVLAGFMTATVAGFWHNILS